jgi:hypothetical protein
MGEAVLKSPSFRPLRAVLSLSLLALVALIAGCGGDGGGGGGDEDAKAVIDKAFTTQIDSANITLEVKAEVEGVAQAQGPFQVKLSGPFKSNGETKLPSFDWDANASGGGQSIAGGLISTGDQLFVNYQNQNFEVPKEQVDQINQQLASQQGEDQSAAQLGINPKDWVIDAEDKGDEEINGEETTHIEAGVDVSQMLEDLNKAAEQASGAMGGSAPSQLTPQQIDQVEQFVKDPKIDVYASKEDGGLRRLNVSIDFEIPEEQRAQLQGATGGNLTFSLDLADVGQEPTIEAPTDAKPLDELQGSLGALGGGGTTPDGSSGSGGSGGSGGSSPDAEKLEEYSKCLQEADPSDSAAIQKCSAILE